VPYLRLVELFLSTVFLITSIETFSIY
jgi:hypothetical protein